MICIFESTKQATSEAALPLKTLVSRAMSFADYCINANTPSGMPDRAANCNERKAVYLLVLFRDKI